MEFNHADLFEGIVDAIGNRVALIYRDQRLTYAEMDARANRLAHHLLSAGVEPGQHVGIQLYNGVEYIAAVLAALKIRAVPINVNYRYVEDELLYIYRDSDMVALVYDVEFDERVASAGPQVPALRHFISVGGASAVPGSIRYEQAIAVQPPTRGFDPRSGDDVYIIYTGGTTGMPKGVMWHMQDLFYAFGGGNPYGEPHSSPEQVIEFAKSFGQVIMMPVAPLMHGAAQMATFIGWWLGATIVYCRKFDPADVLATIERERVLSITITGDAMARPLAAELAAGSYDMSSLAVLVSTGAILTGTVRDRLKQVLPHVDIQDRFGSTESGSTAFGTSGSSPEAGLRFDPTVPGLAVLDANNQQVTPGSPVVGQVAKTGNIAFGYYNDPDKTVRTFVTVDGVRWLLTGDVATVDADGTIRVYGRGSQAINTGGEKVFPEEVEAVLKGHPGVFDAVVTGVPDERYGWRVAAVVQAYEARPAEEDLDKHCREKLAGYKVPRSYVFVDEMKRSPAGKADYTWARSVAASA